MRDEEGEGLKGMAYMRKPIDQKCPPSHLFLYLGMLGEGKEEVRVLRGCQEIWEKRVRW